jgi:hypothetical protein
MASRQHLPHELHIRGRREVVSEAQHPVHAVRSVHRIEGRQLPLHGFDQRKVAKRRHRGGLCHVRVTSETDEAALRSAIASLIQN